MMLDALVHDASRMSSQVADLWVTLGRAFLPPLEPAHWRALHADLPLDLDDWNRELGLADMTPASNLLAAMTAYGEHEALLVHYSALFYAPPVRVHLNIGLYADGALNGSLLDALARWHGAYGLDRSATFHDLTDHLAAVLEFLGLITRLEENHLAGEFAHTFLIPVLPRMIRAVELEGALASPYLWLLRYTLNALEACYPTPDQPKQAARPRYRKRPLGDGWRHCARCEAPIATERELAVMEKALAQVNLPVDHLTLCQACRDQARGWEKHALPRIR